MLIMLTTSQHKDSRLPCRGLQLVCRLSKTPLSDKLPSKNQASYLLASKSAKTSKPFSKGEFQDIRYLLSPPCTLLESKDILEKMSLSRRTELIDEDLANKLNKKVQSFTLYSLALDESSDTKDTAQLLIFIRGITDSCKITQEFLAIESLRRKTRREDLLDSVLQVIDRHKLPWSTLANVTTDGSPNLTGKNIRLLRRIQKRVKEGNLEQEVIFLHCIIHQEALCKSILHLDHVGKPVNFI